jgi:hypothetical protein
MRMVVSITCLLILAGCGATLSSTPANLLALSDRKTSGVPAGVATRRIYAVNNAGNSLTAYRANANGNVAPSVTISGSNTQLSTPINIATGFKHRLFVSNLGSNAVTEYAGSANGNAAPLAVITCGGLDLPDGIAAGSSTPLSRVHIYVANLKGNSISIFPAGAHGCARAREINGSNTQLSRPAGLLISSGILYVGNINSHSITEYPASASGNVTPTTVISGGNTMLVNPVGLALDSSQNLYVADDSAQAVFVFAPGASGNVSPIRVVTGSNTGLSSPSGIVVTGGSVIVTNAAANSVTSYPEKANGNVAPTTTLQGSATGLNFPIGLVLH